MTAGRPRKPTGLHKIDGTFRADRHGDRADAAHDFFAVPEKPADLVCEAEDLWDQVVGRLASSQSTSDLDTASLHAMCLWWQRFLDLNAKATEFAWDDERAEMYENRAIKAWRAFDRIASRFGMTPADRAKLKSNPKDEQKKANPLESLGIVG